MSLPSFVEGYPGILCIPAGMEYPDGFDPTGELNDVIMAQPDAQAVSGKLSLQENYMYNSTNAVAVSTPLVRAKFRLVSVEPVHDQNGEQTAAIVRAEAVTSGPGVEENAQWSKLTPAGSLQLYITNLEAVAQFLPGLDAPNLSGEFYLDLVSA